MPKTPLIKIVILLSILALLFLLEKTFAVENSVKPIRAIVTAYTSLPHLTDSSPEITASNQKVREGIVANNCLEFGTKVKIEGKGYEVQDRMNKRYSCEHWDIWFPDEKSAINWGVKKLVVYVVD